MGIPSVPHTPERPTRLRKWRLWHLAVGVGLAALVLGGVRALTRGVTPSELEGFVGFAGVWVLACLVVVFILNGAKLGHRATRRVRSWGLARGGVVGFSVWFIGIGVNLAIGLGATALGIVLIVDLFVLLTRLTG